jgi:hypothetical protein
VERCCRQLPEIHLRLIRHWGKISLLSFELHSWKLGADIGVYGFLFILKEPLEVCIILQDLIRPFVRLLLLIQEPEGPTLPLALPYSIYPLNHPIWHWHQGEGTTFHYSPSCQTIKLNTAL